MIICFMVEEIDRDGVEGFFSQQVRPAGLGLLLSRTLAARVEFQSDRAILLMCGLSPWL